MKRKTSWEKYFSQKIEYVNFALRKFLPKDNSTISKSMRYSVLAGGKRLRSVLLIFAAELFGGKFDDIIPAACAVEYFHTYSLIHDDLPAMDNDDFRRGIPTNHKKFGEAVAILCGDALLTESFNLITKVRSSEKNINLAIRILANCGGYKGMIFGQIEDVIESGKWNKKKRNTMMTKLKFIEIRKTAALIVGSLKIGAILSDADKKSLKALEVYGTNIGIAFQIVDDILDLYATNNRLLGKNGSDVKNEKLTAVSVYGEKKAEIKANEYIDKAKKALIIFGDKSTMLMHVADYIMYRLHL
ncbi:MAG: polyprenyl synthetase family protein [Endomicrobium sp.]|nr:polyprenyl synthetase family protein [Endomicrobium sp.]